MSDLREHLQAVYDRHGRLTASLVLEAATPEASPLHDLFEWDDSAAAEAYRLDQARRIIMAVRVVYRDATETEPARSVRAWHAVHAPEEEGRYEPAEKVAADPLLRRIVLRDMERDWLAFRRRYEQFAEFWPLVTGQAPASAGQGEALG
jgi:hypothetical protein